MVNSYIRKSDLDPEMTVVRNEFESGENNPQLVLYGRMLASAFMWHNYGHLQIGARSDIENVDIGRLQAFYRLYYQPDNAVLIVAGKFDPDATLRLIVKDFGPIPKPARTLPPIYTEEPVQDGERTVTLRRTGGSKFLGMMYHTVRGAHPDYVALDVLGDVLTVPPAGRLYKALVTTKKASSVEAWMNQLREPGTLAFFAQIPDADPIAPARDAMFATIEGLAKEPVTEAEVARIRGKAAVYFDETMANPQRFAVAISESVALGDWRLFFITRDRYRTVTATSVNRVAQEYLQRSNVTVGEFIPDAKPARAPVPPPVDLAAIVKDYKGDAAAATGEAFDASPANLDARTERFVLPNGAKVALLPKKTRGEAVRFTVSLHYADLKQAFGKQADGQLAGEMLLRGTTRHTRQEIEDALDALRAKLAINGSSVGTSVSGQTFRKELPDTLRLLAEVLRLPSFPADELETLQREETTGLEESRTDPQEAALRASRRQNNPYPAGDPRYGPTLEESLAWTRAVTVDSLKRFHAQFFGASNAEIAIVGDFDAAAVKALVTEALRRLEEPFAVRARAGPVRAEQGSFGKTRSPRQGQCVPDRARGNSAQRPEPRLCRDAARELPLRRFAVVAPVRAAAAEGRPVLRCGVDPHAELVRAEQPVPRVRDLRARESRAGADGFRGGVRRGDDRRVHRRRGADGEGKACCRSGASRARRTAPSRRRSRTRSSSGARGRSPRRSTRRSKSSLPPK